MSRRHLRRLERAIRAAEEANLGGKLGLQMKMARRILEQLRRIERLRFVRDSLKKSNDI